MRGGRDQRARAVDHQPDPKAELAAPDIGQLAAGDHQGSHRQREGGDGGLDAAHVVPRSVAMLLMATFIVVPAKLHRNCASTSGTSIARPAGFAGAAAVVAATKDVLEARRSRHALVRPSVVPARTVHHGRLTPYSIKFRDPAGRRFAC